MAGGGSLGRQFWGVKLARGIEAGDGPIDLGYWRHRGVAGQTTGAGQELAYAWGRSAAANNNQLAAGNFTWSATHTDRMLCIPWHFPRAVTLAKLLYKDLATLGNGFRFAIYDNDATYGAYPGAKVWTSSTYSPTALQMITETPNLAIPAGSLRWLVLQANAGNSHQTWGIFSDDIIRILGTPPAAWAQVGGWSNYQQGVGWLIPQTYASGLPSIAPQNVGETVITAYPNAGSRIQLPLVGATFAR